MSRPTIAAVAQAAGVSVASVSRVLNGLPATEEMAERVQRAVEQLGYVPDSRARSLKVGRTFQLTLAVADVGNPVYVTMMRAVEEVVSAAGYRLVVTTTGADVVDEVALVRGMARGYADGLLISPIRVDEDLVKSIRECEVPVVVAGNVPAKAGVDTVRANSPKGMLLAVDHLVARGRRRIAFLNGPADTVPGTARAKGFADALRKHDLEPVAVAEATDFTFAAGRAAAPDLLAAAGLASSQSQRRRGVASPTPTPFRPEGGTGALDGTVVAGLESTDAGGPEGGAAGLGRTGVAGLESTDSRGPDGGGATASTSITSRPEGGGGGVGGVGSAGSGDVRGRVSAAPFDAVIAANDLLAVGLMHELAAAGLRVPGDVAVVGMDDSELAEQSFPPLTSVNLGSAERGRRAAELLLARIEDNDRRPRRIVVQPSLSVRRSTP
ncbi:LacI family transcriptional regulator [Kribbella pittospori]|uniref:LacI family transcriptional regulator n=1 Tax=Kribbella pittospori TaxID=722689 RepID=A0A4R0JH94_9ACTN|nr:LacI family DNA-binding transcriptional regulator [Kribbella pittospori]TCC46291.1 LacI family transcriptional regulator [Kribbella pittospori]